MSEGRLSGPPQAHPPANTYAGHLLRRFIRGIFDIRFSYTITEKLMPAIYVAALFGCFAISAWLTAETVRRDIVFGLVFAVVVAPFIFFGLAALVRVLLEFFVAMFDLSQRFQRLADIVESLDASLKRMDQPMEHVADLAADLRAIQVWRRFLPDKETGGPAAADDSKTPEPN